MKLGIRQCAIVLVLFLAGGVAWAGSSDMWLHINVEEAGPEGDRVYINLPLDLIEALLPLIETGDDSEGTVTILGGSLSINCGRASDLELEVLRAAVRDAEDAEYVTVEGSDETVRVAKRDGCLIVNVDEPDATVRIKMRMEVVDAFLEGDLNNLNLVGAVQALRRHGEGELVRVESEDETVRIWIDSQHSGR
ncbi:MAG: hypothetical protein KAY24_07755 [Candidatus Eisenbacteria sp.]|nr:hypothetical protein [Candidatus Eisenbacteria bacterium]